MMDRQIRAEHPCHALNLISPVVPPHLIPSLQQQQMSTNSSLDEEIEQQQRLTSMVVGGGNQTAADYLGENPLNIPLISAVPLNNENINNYHSQQQLFRYIYNDLSFHPFCLFFFK